MGVLAPESVVACSGSVIAFGPAREPTQDTGSPTVGHDPYLHPRTPTTVVGRPRTSTPRLLRVRRDSRKTEDLKTRLSPSGPTTAGSRPAPKTLGLPQPWGGSRPVPHPVQW